MALGRVVIIESDEWAATLLAKFLRDEGYEVAVLAEARAGFDKIRSLQPHCILCAVNLPDIDGFWVARRVRAEPPPVNAIPFVFFTEANDSAGRLQGFKVGADLFVNRPYRTEEAVAQVRAIIEMAKRLRGQSTALPNPAAAAPASSAGPFAFEGNLAEISVSTVLSVLEMERRTGRLKVQGESSHIASFDLIEGALARAELDRGARDPTQLLRDVLRWKQGSFRFRTVKVPEAHGQRQTMSELLLEAMRQEDEGRR